MQVAHASMHQPSSIDNVQMELNILKIESFSGATLRFIRSLGFERSRVEFRKTRPVTVAMVSENRQKSKNKM